MIKDYQIIEKIGKGTFGIVYKVQRINDPLIYVIKQISLNGLTEEQIVRRGVRYFQAMVNTQGKYTAQETLSLQNGVSGSDPELC